MYFIYNYRNMILNSMVRLLVRRKCIYTADTTSVQIQARDRRRFTMENYDIIVFSIRVMCVRTVRYNSSNCSN